MEELRKLFKFSDETDKTQLVLLQDFRNILKRVGLVTDKIGFKAYLRIIPIVLFYNMIQYGQIGHIIHYLTYNKFSFFEVADDIAVILTCNTATYINITILSLSPYTTEVCQKLGNFNDPDLGRARGIVALDRLFFKFAKACIVLFLGVGLFTWIFYAKDHCAPGEVSTCGFIFIPYLHFADVYTKPWRQIALICQVCSSYTGGALAVLNVTQYIFVNEVLILRYEHLASLIKRIPTLKKENRAALLGRIVRYHCILIDINLRINKGMSRTYGLHLAVTPINMGVIAFQLIGKEIILSSVMHFLSYVFLTTITCASGERLTTKTEKLAETIYESMPLDDVKTSKDMKFMLFKAQYPLRSTAGGVTYVNHVMLGNIYQTVWSMLTLLIQTS